VEGFERAHQQNAPRIAQFQQNRETLWRQVHGSVADRARMARERGAGWTNYRSNLWSYRFNRADEIWDRARDAYDDLFTYDWWRSHRGRAFLLGGYSPWWWWNPCAWNTLESFCGFGWNTPIYYDYDANVIVDGDYYVDGQDMGPAADYSQQALQLANPPVIVEEPVPPQEDGAAPEWQPLGVFAVTQQEQGDAALFFQLAVSKGGLISGAFTNPLTDESGTVTGSVDTATQRAAWHIGDKTNTAYEVGVANLTQNVAPVLIHFGTQTTQTWLLVRMPSPDLPLAPAQAVAPAL
jgi:hypothetical protein